MSRPRLLFYSHDTVGLGHLSRTLTVAEEIARRRRDVAMLVVTGAPAAGDFALPDTVELVRLPTRQKRAIFAELPVGGISPPAGLAGLAPSPGIWHVRAETILGAVRGFAPDVLVADHHPNGVHNELVPALTALRASGATRTLTILDEFVDEPETVRRIWGGAFADLLRAGYDRVVIRGDEQVFPTAEAYGLPSDLLPRTSYSGYCARDPDPAAVAAARARLAPGGEPSVVITAGGGNDAGDLLRACVIALAGLAGVRALVVTGPLLPEPEVAGLRTLAAGNPGLLIETSVPDLTAYLAAADVAIAMAGYSSIAELMALRKQAIVIPRIKPWREQLVRARRFAELGLVTMIHPDESSPERLRAAISSALAAPPPPDWVDCDGRRRQAEAIIDLLPRPGARA